MYATMPLLFICGGATFCLFATPEAVFGDSACAGVAGAVVPQPNAPAVKSEKTASEQRPKCQLKLLSAEVRVKREKGHRSLLEKDPGYRVPRRVPTEVEATNPIIFRDYFAVVIFENSTRHPLELYGLRKRGNEDAADPRSAFILEIEIRDATNRVVKAKPTGLISIAPPRFPSAKELSSQEHHTVIAFQPKQKLEIECSILDNLKTSRRRK